MIIHSLSSRHEFMAGDGTTLRELLHGQKDGLSCGYSLAQARLAPGQASFLHRLATSEVYYILVGRGRMEIGGEVRDVSVGDTVYIPPGAAQRITNSGPVELAFLCIVDPAWREENEEIIELK
jgi:mannose-6-phosphate isomerase-like protein (cupin superfamily)